LPRPDAVAALAARLGPDSALKATLWYLALTLVGAWPLVASLTTGVPSDLGDPLLNAWILAWNARHLLQALAGDVGALAELWHANIFYPAPYVLGYSELLITQTLLILPVYALTGNIILCYNLLFLAVFVLSGIGMYLFVRALTNDWRAGFIAGLLFAFAPYRFHQAPHLQVMWSPWMPFVLYGLLRWFEQAQGRRGAAAQGEFTEAQGRSGAAAQGARRAWRWLAFAAVMLAAQNLSCGYYMLFFAPFVALYAIWEMARRGRLLDARTWIALALTGAASLALTAPFMTPYFALRRLGQRPRGIEEVASFSADTFAYLTSHGGLYLWGWLQTFPRPEGSLFPGLVPIALTLVGFVAALIACQRAAPRPVAVASRVRRVAIVTVAIVGAVHLVVFVGLFFGLEGRHMLGPLEIRLFSVARPLIIAGSAGVLLLAFSTRARAAASCLRRSPAVFAVLAAFLAFWLSLGPIPRVLGDTLRDADLYTWLYTYVPGFSGLRVPARFAMVVTFFLSMGAGLGYRVLAAAGRAWLLPLVAIGVCADAFSGPLPINGVAVASRLFNPPTSAPTSPTPLTKAIDALPTDAVLLELPFGDTAWEIRYLYFSTFHWRRMVNGYSGDVPIRYVRTRDALYQLPEEGGDRAWQMIRQSRATHVIVHGDAYGAARAAAMCAWLEARGAHLLRQVDEAWIYELR
jgi:hypothetical protein